MGSQHVTLKINDDGLVTSVGESQTNDTFETCVICGKMTDVKISTHIDYRYGYVEGSGQCCRDCYDGSNKRNDDYIKTLMKNRTTLITISAEDIINTPNDFDLGAKVRKLFWETQRPNTRNEWICTICGGNTSEVDYDYLVNTDHLSCHLSK